ncbi:MAG TPA: phage tail protein [Clostridia bacterium]|nr:phage tail protein [Clostridia bacterium]
MLLIKYPIGKKGLSVNLRISESGIELKETDFEVKKKVDLSSLPVLSDDLDFSPGICDVIYVLDRKKLMLSAYDYMREQFIWVRSIGSISKCVNEIAFSKGSFYISLPDNPEIRIAAIAQINSRIRWVVSQKPVRLSSAPVIAELQPLHMAVDEDGCLYVFNASSQNILKINKGGVVEKCFDIGTEIDVMNMELSVRKGILYLLDKTKSYLHIFKENMELVNQGLSFKPSALCIDSNGYVFIGEKVAEASGYTNISGFIYKFGPDGANLGKLNCYYGTVGKLLCDRYDNLIVYDDIKNTITVLEPNHGISRNDETRLPEGSFFSCSLDSTAAGMNWHRILMDAEIPTDTQIKAGFFCADEKRVIIEGKEWDLDEYIGSSIPPSVKYGILAGLNWVQLPPNPVDSLLPVKKGRYLWMRLDLTGNDRKSPLIKSIKIEFPRKSYLRYLPAVYSENDISKDFVERYLSIFQSLFSDLEDQISSMAHNFDADAVSGDYLKWLSSWLAVNADESWSDDKRRKLVKKAFEIYSKRGTREGLEEIIEIYTGSKPFIVEKQQLEGVEEGTYLKKVLDMLFGDDQYTFHVLMNPGINSTKEERNGVRRIVASEKPAFTRAEVIFLRPWIHLDQHTYLGINTCLSKPDLRVDAGSDMPHDTVLSDVKEAGMVEMRTRLGIDTSLT